MLSTNPHPDALQHAEERDQAGELSAPSSHVPGDRAGPPAVINPVETQLSVLLRQTQWLLDDAAHDIPAGRYHLNQRDELANVLEYVAGVVRATKNTTMIDNSDE
ncbi:MAG: hypothetical protein ACRDTG_30705 [Pseudonocardiaceae bacterium]